MKAAVGSPGWHLLPPDDGELNEVASLVEALKYYYGGAALMPPAKGRPVNWERLLVAAIHLHDEGFLIISCTPKSRCVKSMLKFLNIPIDTAAELAGTLKAHAKGMGWKIS